MAPLNRILYAVCVVSIVAWAVLLIATIWTGGSDECLVKAMSTALTLMVASALWLSISCQVRRLRKEEDTEKGTAKPPESGTR